ncbi:MAG: methyltransferase, partial [Bacteroidales bacterium]|nr:methyltransferase [Bacteroidales bacterium]
MKVGTDALLLGALATPYQQPTRILDIGTGCGIIALMMAQRFPNAAIDAIDIDTSSISVATENILHSPWPDRLHC